MADRLAYFTDADRVRGIDVSHKQGSIHWRAVAAAGINFAYVKATEGIGFSDIRFRANFDGARANGILRGAYHFFRPGDDAVAQANDFLHVLQQAAQDGDLPPVLDVETLGGKSTGSVLSGMQKWVDTVQDALGCTVIIYTSAWFWNTALRGSARFTDQGLWVAHYTNKPRPNLPKGFNDYNLWQFTDKGSVDGVSGPVDLDRINGTLEDLQALAAS